LIFKFSDYQIIKFEFQPQMQARHSISGIKNKPMKKDLKRTLMSALLMAGLGLLPAGRVAGQAFNVLINFGGATNGPPPTYLDGYRPDGGLVVSGNTLYGGTTVGGPGSGPGNGMVFKVNIDGTGFTKLCASGASGLTLAGTVLYGADHVEGTLFKVNTDGSGFTLLHDGIDPYGSLVLSSNTLYGTTLSGGYTNGGNGTIFKFNTDGTGFTTLHQFTPYSYPDETNSDGGGLSTSLILSGSTLYGVTDFGGSWGNGTLFRIDTDGSNFTTLYHFNFGYLGRLMSAPVLSGHTLYGIAHDYANRNHPGFATVYSINTDGSGFTSLLRFADLDQSWDNQGNQNSALFLSGTTLYGTMSLDNGSVFTVSTDGTGFTYLHNFTSLAGEYPNPENYGPRTNSDGCYPQCLVMSGNNLYGLTQRGGIAGNGGGTLFSIPLPAVAVPSLAMTFSGTNASLSWPATATGFTLQSTTDLVSGVWSAVPTPAVPVNGQNTVSDPLSSTQRFYRLIK
jgi:uncharacterized repeat protein (TIGR03803 family)